MSASQHLLIRASAGTGKTYRLSGRFLELLFKGVEPERILATTFTRKAAGEILDRVLERVVEAIEDDETRKELGDSIGMPKLSLEDCEALLAKLTRSLHTFQVRTIDSFFVHLVKLFALDLELPPDWSISDERVDDRLRTEALQEVLGQESSDYILLLLRELTKGGAGRSVQDSLKRKIGDLRPVHQESTFEAWDSFPTGKGLSDEALQAAISALEIAELPKTAKGDPNKVWVKARDTFVGRARDGLWDDIISKSGLGPAFYSEDKKFSRAVFPDPVVEIFESLMPHACHVILTEMRNGNLAARSLMETFEGFYQDRKRSEGAYGFSDMPHALAPRTAAQLPIDERELDLWFRLDGRIDHMLLDEFQDTAPVQWRILAPIASEIVSEFDGSRSFFCVGDIKQSIYSFRHAEPRLLAQLDRMLPGIETETMDRSYRSAQVVLDTVNLIFTGMDENEALAGSEYGAYRSACQAWQQDFRPHDAARDLPGAALLIEAHESDKPEPALVEATVRRAEALHTEAPQASIGILLRKRKLIPKLIHLLRERGIDARGEGGNELTDARSVVCFLSLLHLADFPDDSAAAFHVATSPLIRSENFAPDAGIEAQRDFSRRLRLRLAEEGLGEFTRSFALEVSNSEEWSAWDKARFAQLLDQAFSFEANVELRPSAFVDHIRSKKVEAPGSSSVRVMTIHASKGLEFDAVILPELSGPFANLMNSLNTIRSAPEIPFEKVTLRVNKAYKSLSPQLAELYDHNLMGAVEDSLSVLYVAMTRAARRLEMIVPWEKPKTKSTSPTTQGVLRKALAAHGLHEPDEDGVIWEHAGNSPGAEWSAGLKAKEEMEPEEPVSQQLIFAKNVGPRTLPRRSPSAEEGGGLKSPKNALNKHRGADIGTLVHEYLEDLTWIEDFKFDSKRTEQLTAWRNADKSLRASAEGILAKLADSPAVHDALSRDKCQAPPSCDDPQVLAEERFAQTLVDAEGNTELWTGSIDRLVIGREGSQVVYAEIIDYKTDSECTPELVEFYKPQLERYRQVIASQTGLALEDIPARLLFLRTGDVKTV
ncbi:MAG: ATP-dependent helicase/nuclease subunit A [Planctomycetota bacterium]|jgi:ATP-dependent helicase/nuclease subunit A